jgi:hypothetical protein
MTFIKGQTPWNKNKKRPDMVGNTYGFKKGMIPFNKGIKKRTNTGRTHIKKGQHIGVKTEFKKGDKRLIGNQINLGRIPYNKDKEMSEEQRIKLSKENHWNWLGGISENPYPKEFNPKLKLKIRTRDNFTCCLCGKTEREQLEELNRVLTVNHIDFNKNNCNEKNLNTLCTSCNTKINRERDYWTNYFNQS